MKYSTLFFTILILLWEPASAEYRVFKLQWINPDGTVAKERLSTLDPLQFPQYFISPKDLRLVYSRTWICKGNTDDFKPLCPDPKALQDAALSTNPKAASGATSSPRLIESTANDKATTGSLSSTSRP